MSEQMKLETDILEMGRRWQRAWTNHRPGANNAVGNSFGLLCDEITRLRAERPGWDEAIEAAAKVADEWCEKNHWPNGVWGIAAGIRALHPSVAEGRGQLKDE